MIERTETKEKLPGGVVERFTNKQVDIITIGKPLNGRLLFSTKERAEELYPNTAKLRHMLIETLVAEAAANDISTLSILRVDRFNASITKTSDFDTTEAERLAGVTLLRGDDESFYHDGVELLPGEGAVIVTGDCHTITLWSDVPNSKVIAAHAGRNSLHTINHSHVDDVESIVNTAVAKMEIGAVHLHARITAGIGADAFTHPLDHPTYGETNKDMLEHFAKVGGADVYDQDGKIDVVEVIKGQLSDLGVPINNISWDELDTASDNRLWSNRIDGKPRNTILVLNKLNYLYAYKDSNLGPHQYQ